MVAGAQDLKGLDAEAKLLMAVESGQTEIFGRWEFPHSRDSSCDYIIKFRELSTSWVCYTSPGAEFCKGIEISGRFNKNIPVSQEEFLSNYPKGDGSNSAFCFSL